MAAWGVGAFENDDAQDWATELGDTVGESLIASSLQAVTGAEGYIELPACSRALAAAQTVAALFAMPGSGLPETVAGWVARHPAVAQSRYVDLALSAVSRIKTDSEVAELWHQSGHASDWLRSLEDLERRLRDAAGPRSAEASSAAPPERPGRVRYHEGQWFAVPLRNGGYALALLARGGCKTRGGLGYFFGPRHNSLPTEPDTWSASPLGAIYIAWFGGLGIAGGRWPRVPSSRPFARRDWPVPRFRRVDPGAPSRGWLVEYDQEDDGSGRPMRTTTHDATELADLPVDGLDGAGAVEIRLTKLLSLS